MALIKCPDCGKDFSDQAAACPNCGRPNVLPQNNQPDPPNSSDTQNSTPPPATYTTAPVQQKHSGLSIAAFVLSILGCTFWLGLVLAIIDLCRKDKTKKHSLSKASIFICALWFILGLAFATSDTETTTTSDTASITETATLEKTNTETEAETASETASETVSEETTEEETTEEETTEESTATTIVESKEEFIASCQEISYKDMLRNPDNYIGERIVIVAKIQQVLQGGWLDDNEYYRVQTDNDGYDWYFDDEYFMYDYRVDDDTKLLQDDILRIYAEFSGLETVKRALSGNKEEVPAIKAYYIDIIGE